MQTFQQVFLEGLRGEDKFHIVTGPLQAGKSTYCRKLADKFEVPTAYEYTVDKGHKTREGVDVTISNWWQPVMSYGAKQRTNVIETHMMVNGEYPWDKNWKATPNIGGVIQPPQMIQLHFVLPRNYEVYNQRSDELFEWDQLVKMYDYYTNLSKKFPSAKIIR